jgi:hypothetical protein
LIYLSLWWHHRITMCAGILRRLRPPKQHNATFSVRRARDRSITALIMKVSGCASGADSDATNPFARATRLTLLDGRPQKRLAMCFFQGPSTSDELKWLGAFSETLDGAISFFPGFDRLQTWVRVPGKKQSRRLDMEIDHFTLENNRRSWHLTHSNGRERIGSLTTHDLREGRRFWFGLSIADPSLLRVVRRETAADTTGVPQSDIARRIESIMQARDGVEFNIVQLPDEAMNIEFNVHFEFVVGASGFPNYDGGRLGGVMRGRDTFPIRSHRMKLSDTADIEIACLREEGRLQGEVWLVGYGGMGIGHGRRRKSSRTRRK